MLGPTNYSGSYLQTKLKTFRLRQVFSGCREMAFPCSSVRALRTSGTSPHYHIFCLPFPLREWVLVGSVSSFCMRTPGCSAFSPKIRYGYLVRESRRWEGRLLGCAILCFQRFSSTARVFVDRNTKVICQGLTGHQVISLQDNSVSLVLSSVATFFL